MSNTVGIQKKNQYGTLFYILDGVSFFCGVPQVLGECYP
jgi:hypothetical protein